MEITPDKKGLMGLVRRASDGEIVLPEFQRNFVWSRDDITDLLISILRGYFIGTFLLLRVDKENIPFAMRPIAGLDIRSRDLKPEHMVLDGQQRITSLFYVFFHPDIPLKNTKYSYRFFVNLDRIYENKVDEAVFSERTDECNQYLQDSYQFKNHIVPFSSLLDWNDWRYKFESFLLAKDSDYFLNEYHPKILKAWESTINRLVEFEVATIENPKVDKDNDEQIAEVCAIFEKMNSTGVPLSVFDLLTARLYRYRIDLHKLWNETLDTFTLIKKFSGNTPDVFGVLILRTIALKRGREVKSKTLINLRPDDFAKDWRICSKFVNKALERIVSTSEDGFGVFDKKWFPYTTMTSVLAALLLFVDSNKKHLKEGLRLIKRWYWGSVFLERYAGATDSTTYGDYNDVINFLRDRIRAPSFIKEAEDSILNNPNFNFKDVTRRNAVYKGVMNLIAIKGAKDFMADDSIEFWDLDDHHIFPKKYLEQLRYKKDEANTVLNRTLISATANRKIRRSKPSRYMVDIIPSKERTDILHSHLINDEAIKATENDDYNAFVDRRNEEILSNLRKMLS